VFTMEFAEGSWTLYLIYFFNNYIAGSYDWCSLEVLPWTLCKIIVYVSGLWMTVHLI
jgi:hypothetical protein